MWVSELFGCPSRGIEESDSTLAWKGYSRPRPMGDGEATDWISQFTLLEDMECYSTR